MARCPPAPGSHSWPDIAGSAFDPGEPRQIRQRLDPTLVRIHSLPGGHFITSEQLDLLAAAINDIAARQGVGTPATTC